MSIRTSDGQAPRNVHRRARWLSSLALAMALLAATGSTASAADAAGTAADSGAALIAYEHAADELAPAPRAELASRRDVSGAARVGRVIGHGVLGAFLGAAVGVGVGFALVHGDTSDERGLAPLMYGALGGGAGFVLGAVHGAVTGGQTAGAEQRVQGGTSAYATPQGVPRAPVRASAATAAP